MPTAPPLVRGARVLWRDVPDVGGEPVAWVEGVERQTRVVICAARRVEGGCDWFRVELTPSVTGARTQIRLESANAGCVLPQ